MSDPAGVDQFIVVRGRQIGKSLLQARILEQMNIETRFLSLAGELLGKRFTREQLESMPRLELLDTMIAEVRNLHELLDQDRPRDFD